jgi:tryptophan 2,3-dioxygenase
MSHDDDNDAASGCPMHGGGGASDGNHDTDQIAGSPALSYDSYLRVPELLELQTPESDPPAHDELLFITIHQAYELWFNQIIYELETVRDQMRDGDIYEADRLLERVLKIEDLLVEQIHILETMRPRDFLAFRKALEPASGFQSTQFREVEFLSGVKRPEVLKYTELTDDQTERMLRRLEEPSLRPTLYRLLNDKGYDLHVPDDSGVTPEDASGDLHASSDREQLLTDNQRQDNLTILGDIYAHPRDHDDVYSLCEHLVDHDQKLLMWRFHHVRVVERLISTKQGTGGSPGVEYLQSTLKHRAFPLLWEARGELEDESFYGDDLLGTPE